MKRKLKIKKSRNKKEVAGHSSLLPGAFADLAGNSGEIELRLKRADWTRVYLLPLFFFCFPFLISLQVGGVWGGVGKENLSLENECWPYEPLQLKLTLSGTKIYLLLNGYRFLVYRCLAFANAKPLWRKECLSSASGKFHK